MSPILKSQRHLAPLALALLSAVAGVAIYLQALNYPFILDDYAYTTLSKTNLAQLHVSELWRLFITPYNRFSEFLPLRDLSYWFDLALFGMSPSAFRLHNILLYLLCLPLIYATTLALWRFFRPADAASAPWAAAAVTALFALNPDLVESVVWISGRKYVLPNFFSMLAFWFAVRARGKRGLSAPLAAATLLAFVAVMLSKSSYVAVAPIIALLWVVFWLEIPAPDRQRSQLVWPLAILLLAGLLFLLFIAASTGTGMAGFQRATGVKAYFGIEAVAIILASLGWLARLAVSPESRHFFYPVFEDPSFPAMVALGGAVVVAAVAGGISILRKRSLEGFSIAAFLLLCIPYSHLISFMSPSLVQDRYLSLSIWPAILLIVALVWRLKPLPRAAILLALALAWCFQSTERVRDWRNFETLMNVDMRAYPGYYMPAAFKIMFYQLPNIFIQLPQGLYREANETANSITTPEYRDVMILLINADYALRISAEITGKPQEAMELLWKLTLNFYKPRPAQSKWNTPIDNFWAQISGVLGNEWAYLDKHFPDDSKALNDYNDGLILVQQRDYNGAVFYLRAATGSQLLPESMRGTAFKNLGLALLRSGRIDEAEASLRAALLQVNPDRQANCVLSEVYKQTNRMEAAARAQASCNVLAPN